MPAYFRCSNVNRTIAGVIFEPTSAMGGMMNGVYMTSDEKLIAEIRKLVVAGKSGVEEITEQQYLDRIKKKRPDRELNPSSYQVPTPPEQVQVVEKAAVLVDDPAQLPKREQVDDGSPESILRIEPVEIPESGFDVPANIQIHSGIGTVGFNVPLEEE